MDMLTYSRRMEREERRIHPLIILGVVFLSILLQAYVPLRFHRFAALDLPLLVTIYFSVTRRSPITGTLTGMLIGLVQDLLTQQKIGIHGMINSLIGYLAASTGAKIDTDNPGTRLLMSFVFTMMEGFLYFVLVRYVLGLEDRHWLWYYELIRALINALVGVVLFAVLDRARQND